MSRADELRSARSTYTVAWREFIIHATRAPKSLFCFFEGEDNRYFIGRIEPLLKDDDEIKALDCGGKGAVMRINELWFKRYQGRAGAPKCLFFLDRDFDCKGAMRIRPPVYITPTYSIENLFVTERSVRRIVENEFKVNGEEDLDRCDAIDFFEKMLAQFLDASSELNAWIFLQRKYEAHDPQGYKCHLNNVNFRRLFRVQKTGVQKLYSHADLQAWLPEARQIEAEELSRYVRWLRATNRRKVFRGKYLIEFLRDVLQILREDRGSKSPVFFNKKGKVTMNLASGNIVSILSQYATTPQCLKEFLSNSLELSLFRPSRYEAEVVHDQNT